MASTISPIDAALQHLVTSIVGRNEYSESLHMARRLLDSSIGHHSSPTDVSSAWRRLERTTTPEVRRSVQDLQARLERVSEEDDTANQLLVVLSQLATTRPRQQPTSSFTTTGATNTSVVIDKKQLQEEETLLLRECLYALQGMDGNNLSFNSQDEFKCDFNNDACKNPALVVYSKLGNGAHDALQVCGQAGWYYRRIQAYVDDSSRGSIARAWAEALSLELNQTYHSLLADLEAQLQGDSDLTLRRLVVRLSSPTRQLKTLAVLTDGLTGLSGGPLLTALHRHSLHGDTRHSLLTQNMLRAASQPWYHALYLWTIQGVLVADEFFVQRSSDGDDVWHSTFFLLRDQVPAILPPSLVQLSFNVGKGINFIRHCLLDAGWKMELGNEEEEDLENLGYRYSREKELAQTMRRAEQQVNQHIVASLREKHHMMHHLRALTQFLLLGQGDFFSVLMEGLHAEFDGSDIIGIYDYALMGIVDGAVKCTNAIDMPTYVLGRLGVKLNLDEDDDVRFQFGPPKDVENKDTRTGWDIFTLDYKIPGPLAVIVHERAMEQYQRVFSMLFGLKRVEFMLNLTWRQSTDLHHAIQIFAQYNAIHMATNTEYAQTTALLRHISMTRQSMMHFVVNLKSYLFFEVLEGAWKTLSTQLETGSSLDDFILAHDAYLADIVQKSLLGNDDNDDAVAEALGLQLRSLLTLALEFCTFQEQLFRIAIQQAEMATKKRKEAERRSKQGDWGFVSEKDVKEAKTFFGLTDPLKMSHVIGIGEDFNQSTQQLLTSIHEISHGKTSTMNSTRSPSTSDSISTAMHRDQFNHDSLNSLTFQLDYSSFYNVGET